MKTLAQTNLELQIMVFKTSIRNKHDVLLVECVLNYLPGIRRWTVDLDDWERILKVEADEQLAMEEIESRIGKLGFECKELDH